MPGVDSFSKLVLNFYGNGEVDGGVSTTDISASAHSVTFAGNAQIDSAQSKFPGGLSCLLDGNDNLSIADHADLDLGTGDFCMETFLRFNNVNDATFFSRNASNIFKFFYTGTNLRFDTNGNTVINQAWSPSTGVWYHLALAREGSNNRLFVDGVQLGATATDSFDIQGSSPLLIGYEPAGGQGLDGWLGPLRLSKGAARYTANFTPPTAPFSADASVPLFQNHYRRRRAA